MSKSLIQLDLLGTDAQAKALLDFGSTGEMEFMQALQDVIGGMVGGNYDGALVVKLAMDYATITGTFSGAPTNADTITIGGQDITAVTSGATANQFNIAGTAAGNAAACAAAINASATLGTWVVASSNEAVLTVRAIVPGPMGNAITLADSMNNFAWAGAATRLASGAQDTNYTYTFGRAAESS